MLPDLWRMADRHVRPARGPVEAANPRVAEVLEGIAHHERADRAFHACEAFHEGEHAMTRALATLGAPRLSLFGHIAWELCLDGALVRREGALRGDVQGALAAACEATDGESAADAAARLHHAARKGAPLPAAFVPRMNRMLGELGRGAWIEGYARGDVVAERLDGLRGRLGLPPMEREARGALAAVLDEAIAGADAQLDAVLALRV
jgi:hypothetical protein